MVRFRWFWLLLILLAVGLAGCERPDPTPPVLAAQIGDPAAARTQPTPTVEPTAIATTGGAPSVPAPPPLTPTPVVVSEPLSPACGQLLAAVPLPGEPTTRELSPDEEALAQLFERVPVAAEPALRRLLEAPGTVGLVAYQMGQEEQGIFLNADTPMPLASVIKTIHLVAYVEAVATGELNPLEPVSLAVLETFYLPNSDLGAHRLALEELEADGRLLATDPPTILLEDVPWMMVRHSSNAATDYLHQRLGQVRIEETAQQLGLTQQTAPCPFLGQFLLMGNHARPAGNGVALLNQYLTPAAAADYGRDVVALTDAFQSSDRFRAEEIAWRGGRRRIALDTQRFFSEYLTPQGSAREYAALMVRLAQNGLSNPDSSYQARRYLEWPMRFPVNQELFSNLGYKGGSLPGVLTGVYYAYRLGEVIPVTVALFYRDLPQQTYRQWREDFPHDELARWLLADPEAIPLLRAVVGG